MSKNGKFWTDKLRNRVEIVALVAAALLILLVAEGFRAHNQLVDQLRQWVVQQRQIQVEAARQQGLIPKEASSADGSAGDTVRDGAAPRTPN